MKKLIVTACAAIASAVALASTVESSNVFGVLKVAGSDGTTTKEFIIPVPWEAVGTAGTAISPTALVLASALNDPDALLFEYGNGTSGKFGAWYIDNNGTWATANISEKNLGDYVEASTRTEIGRGYALILRTKSQNIYLSGQYATGGSIKLVANGQTLIASPTAADFYLYRSSGTADVDFSPTEGDEIFTNSEYYIYTGSKWKTVSAPSGNTMPSNQPTGPNYTEVSKVMIPQGQGAWYSNKGEEKTLNFN